MSLYINEEIKRLEALDQKCGLIQHELSRRKEEVDRHNEIASLEERLSNTNREKTSPNDREKAGDETSSLFLLNILGSNGSNNPLYRDALRERLQELQGTTPTAVKIPDRDLVSQLQALPSIDYKLSQDLDLTDSNALTHIILGIAAARQALKKQVKNLQQQREDLRQQGEKHVQEAQAFTEFFAMNGSTKQEPSDTVWIEMRSITSPTHNHSL